MAVLIITDGPAKDQKYSLEGERLCMIGRDAKCSFQIIDAELSRFHLQIRHDPPKDQYFAIDYQSKNGVEINGNKIERETQLTSGDVITIGVSTLIFSTDNSMDAKRAFETWKRFGQGHVHTISPD